MNKIIIHIFHLELFIYIIIKMLETFDLKKQMIYLVD